MSLDPFAGASPRGLVGRAREAALITRELDALCAPGAAPRLLQVTGEPGIGKSALLRAIALQARERGCLVLSGRAAEFEAELPFGVVLSALEDWLADRSRAELQTLAGPLAAELAVVFPRFEELTPPGPPPAAPERYRAYRAVRTLLANIAQTAPLVVLLDDVQWADPGSLELIAHLAGRPPRGAVMLVTAYRPAQLPRRLGAALSSAVQEQRATRLELALLGADTAAELLGSAVDAGEAASLFRESGGNPFFLLQLARGATTRARRASGRSLAGEIPEPVRLALAGELAGLSSPALNLLHGAAVAGDPFTLAAAAAAAELESAPAHAAIDELLALQLVFAAGPGHRFAFRHPIVRAAVYESAGTGWLTAAHGRLAALLADEGASPSARAPHVERSAAAGDRAAIALLTTAGAESAARTPALAARWYGAALRLLGNTGDQRTRTELQSARATALHGAGQLEESRLVLVALIADAPAGDPARGRLIATCAAVEHLLGRHRQARERLASALRDSDDPDSAEAVALRIELAAGAGFESEAEDMRGLAAAALTGARRIGSAPLELAACGQVALAAYLAGAADVGTAMDQAAARFDAAPDHVLAERPDTGIWIGWSEAVLERHDRAVAHCRRVVEVCRATGQSGFLPLTLTAMAWALIRQGQLTEAEDALATAIDAGRVTPHLFSAVAHGLRAVLASQRGDLTAAIRAGEEAVAQTRRSDDGLIPGMCGLYLAIPLIELGDAARARGAVLARAGGPELPLMSRSGHCTAYEVLTRAELALGSPAAAEQWARRARAATHGAGLPVETACADRAQAMILLHHDRSPQAAAIALGAAARLDGAGAPVEAARCRILAARALGRGGDREGAIAELRHAADASARCGADGHRAEAERELRRLGRRVSRSVPPTRAADPLGVLTPREREIAELVGAGRTNREIAAIALLSERTVERHLTHVYTKVGVSNRSGLAALVIRSEHHS